MTAKTRQRSERRKFDWDFEPQLSRHTDHDTFQTHWHGNIQPPVTWAVMRWEEHKNQKNWTSKIMQTDLFWPQSVIITYDPSNVYLPVPNKTRAPTNSCYQLHVAENQDLWSLCQKTSRKMRYGAPTLIRSNNTGLDFPRLGSILQSRCPITTSKTVNFLLHGITVDLDSFRASGPRPVSSPPFCGPQKNIVDSFHLLSQSFHHFSSFTTFCRNKNVWHGFFWLVAIPKRKLPMPQSCKSGKAKCSNRQCNCRNLRDLLVQFQLAGISATLHLDTISIFPRAQTHRNLPFDCGGANHLEHPQFL